MSSIVIEKNLDEKWRMLSLRNAKGEPKYWNPVQKKIFLDPFLFHFSTFYDILRRFGEKKFLCPLVCRSLARFLAL